MVEKKHYLGYNLQVNVGFCIQSCEFYKNYQGKPVYIQMIFIKTAYGDTPQREEGTRYRIRADG